jgi:hypothetical protein
LRHGAHLFSDLQKFRLTATPTLRYIGWVLSHSEGRVANVTDAGQDAVDAAASGAKRHRRAGIACERWTGARTNGVETPRAESGGSHTVRRKVLAEVAAYGKAVWSWHPLLVSSWRRFLRAQPGGQAINPSTTVARRIRRRGERGISRKTIAQGEPGVSGYLWSTVCIFCTRTAGAKGTRLSLRPLIFMAHEFSCTTRALRAAGSRNCVCGHCERSRAISSKMNNKHFRYGLWGGVQ